MRNNDLIDKERWVQHRRERWSGKPEEVSPERREKLLSIAIHRASKMETKNSPLYLAKCSMFRPWRELFQWHDRDKSLIELGSGQSGKREHEVTRIDYLLAQITLARHLRYTGEQRNGVIAQ